MHHERQMDRMDAIGRHLLIDCWGCGQRAADAEAVCRAMHRAVEAMGATLLELKVHCFMPRGLTAVAILAESHLALHSWPEEDYVAIDAFTCGQSVRPDAGLEVLLAYLQPKHLSHSSIGRGRRPVPVQRAQSASASNQDRSELLLE